MLKFFSLGAALLGAAVAQQTQSLNATLAANNGTLSTLTSLLAKYPSLLSALESASNITILAPSNEAFATLLNTTAGKAVANDTGLLEAVLQYHVLNGTYPASSITNTSSFVPSLLTNTSYTNVTGGQVVEAVASDGNVTIISGLLNNVSVVTADVNFTGGVVHVIDGVLTLPANVSTTAVSAGLTSLAGALGAVNLTDTVDTLSDVTIFAPNNAAFQRIASALSNASTQTITDVLEYHVVNGTVGYSTDLTNGQKLTAVNGGELTIRINNGSVFVNGAEVVTPNVLVANGVVHVIDNVLNPNNTSASPSASATAGAPGFTGASSASEPPFTSGVSAASTTTTGASTTSTSSGNNAPMKTAAVGAAALFGAGAVFAVNL